MRAEAIVDAASRLFALRGFRGTTVAAVAKEVGMTDAGVLHHFATKRELLGAVLERSTLEQAENVRAMLSVGGVEALKLFAARSLEAETDSHYTGLEITISAEALDADSDLHQFFVARYRVVRRWFARAIDKGVELGEFRAGIDAELEASRLIAFLDGIRLQWYFGTVESLSTEVQRYIDDMIERLSA